MTRIKFFIYIFISLFIFVSCSKQKPDDSKAESRFEILTYDSDISETLTLDTSEILLGVPKSYTYWSKTFQNPQNNLGHIESLASFSSKKTIFPNSGNSLNLFQPIYFEKNVCHVLNKGQLQCKNIENKEIIFSLDVKPEGSKKYEIVRGGLAYFDGVIVFVDAYGQIKAINSSNGSVVWEKKIDYPVLAAPLIYRDQIFLISADNRIISIDFKSGDIIWSFQTIEEAKMNLFSASPAAAENVIIAPFSSGEIIAFKYDDGQILWSENTSKISIISNFNLKDISANPIISGSSVYSLSNNGKFLSNSMINGQRNWSTEIKGSQTPIISGEQIYLIDNESRVICLNKNTGEIYWINYLDKFKRGDSFKNLNLWLGPYLINSVLYTVSYFGELVAISPLTGEILSDKKLGVSEIYSPLIILNNQFLITNSNGNIYSFK